VGWPTFLEYEGRIILWSGFLLARESVPPVLFSVAHSVRAMARQARRSLFEPASHRGLPATHFPGGRPFTFRRRRRQHVAIDAAASFKETPD